MKSYKIFFIGLTLASLIFYAKALYKNDRKFSYYKNKDYNLDFTNRNLINIFSTKSKIMCLNKCLQNRACISVTFNSIDCKLYYNTENSTNMIDSIGNDLYVKKYIGCGNDKVYNGAFCERYKNF